MPVARGGPVAVGAEHGVAAWTTRDRRISLAQPLVMGVLNVTPDSFSDGGRFAAHEAALRRAAEMLEEGAGMIDVGGESTRPGADPVPVEEEIRRVVPIVQLLKRELDVAVSVDTRKGAVARAALDAGAEVVNDVSALADPDMAPLVARSGAGVVLMHMRGTPQTMQRDPRYRDVAGEVAEELRTALDTARSAGIGPERIVLDPGIGFAKTAAHNLELIARLGELARLGLPVLLGVSRKAFIGGLLGGAPPEARVSGTAAACVVGLLHGARIFRVHDVRVVREALVVAEAIRVASTTGS